MGGIAMETKELKAVIEGLLFACGDEGITIKALSHITGVTKQVVEHILDELNYDYEHTARGMMLLHSHGVYHLTTKPEHSQYFKKLLETPQTTKLSQVALETLAIIAYKQPITRIEIEEIRGVNSDRPVQTLVARSLVEEVGRKEAIGRPILYGTTMDFLTYFGLTSLKELPPFPETVDTKEIEEEADLFFERFAQLENNTPTTK